MEEIVEMLKNAEQRAQRAEERAQQVETILEAAVRDAVQILRNRCVGDLDVLALVANRMTGALQAVRCISQVACQHDRQDSTTRRSHGRELATWCSPSELDGPGVGCSGDHSGMVWGAACASSGPCSIRECHGSMNLLNPRLQNLLIEYNFRLAMFDMASC